MKGGVSGGAAGRVVVGEKAGNPWQHGLHRISREFHGIYHYV
jgi:hypothetical protein